MNYTGRAVLKLTGGAWVGSDQGAEMTDALVKPFAAVHGRNADRTLDYGGKDPSEPRRSLEFQEGNFGKLFCFSSD